MLINIFKKIFHDLFDHIIAFTAANIVWFLIALFLPAKLFFIGYCKTAILVFIFLIPLSCSMFYTFSIHILSISFSGTIKSFFFRNLLVTFLWSLTVALFAFNSLFYYASVSMGNVSFLNASFFFLSIWLTLISFCIIVFLAPISIRKNNIKEIFSYSISLYFKNLRSTFTASFIFFAFVAFSFLFLFIIFMPLISLFLIHFFDLIEEKY